VFWLQCYYIGATDIAATKLINSVTKPMSFSKPVEKICEDLKKKDAQICELKHGMYDRHYRVESRHQTLVGVSKVACNFMGWLAFSNLASYDTIRSVDDYTE